MIYYFMVPDMAIAALQLALRASACPNGAEIRAEGLSGPGVVSITTPGVWRADGRGNESGVGVPGWSLISSEPTGAARDLVEEGKTIARRASATPLVRL